MVGLQKLIFVTIRFKESSSIFQTTQVFLKLRKYFNWTKDLKVVKNLPLDKVSASEIPNEILKESTFCFSELSNCINKSLTNNKILDTLKLSDIMPVFKNFDPSDKANYRLGSIL